MAEPAHHLTEFLTEKPWESVFLTSLWGTPVLQVGMENRGRSQMHFPVSIHPAGFSFPLNDLNSFLSKCCLLIHSCIWRLSEPFGFLKKQLPKDKQQNSERTSQWNHFLFMKIWPFLANQFSCPDNSITRQPCIWLKQPTTDTMYIAWKTIKTWPVHHTLEFPEEEPWKLVEVLSY